MRRSPTVAASKPVDVSFLVCTFNRKHDLEELVESLVQQRLPPGTTYEILIVDNASTDGTARFVERKMSEHPELIRYVYEGRAGKSHALNAGLAALRGEVYVIADDDLVFPDQWLEELIRVLEQEPAADFIGGRVLPLWRNEPPKWLTAMHWPPLALLDAGDTIFRADRDNPVCLLACAFRTRSVIDAGGYDPDLSVSGERIGGTEDADLLYRLWERGGFGIYAPDMRLYHKVQPIRITKSYHRRWHRGHGKSRALMRSPSVEASKYRFLNVPSHMYRTAMVDILAAIKARLLGRSDLSFFHEARLHFFAGFFCMRANFHSYPSSVRFTSSRFHATPL